MAEILKDHGRNTDNISHVNPSSKVTSEQYADKGDPLSSSSDVANKPGSSIPSIFGRMIFFRTALLSIKADNINWKKGVKAPPYHQIVSQWLDAMELVFNQSHSLRFECWNRNEQLKLLEKTHHNELADAFEKQSEKFLEGVDNIYLIYKDGKLVGGTSPYTFVFTSPNWNSGLPVKSLLERKTDFRRFMYRIYCVFNTLDNTVRNKSGRQTSNKSREMVSGVLDYLKLCLSKDNANLKREFDTTTSYRETDLLRDYLVVSYIKSDGASKPIEIVKLLAGNEKSDKDENEEKWIKMYLLARKADALESDFFIDSSYFLVKEGEREIYQSKHAPLILATGNYESTMYLYDDVAWQSDWAVPQVENERDDDRPIPNCDSFLHNWLTTVDFLEDKLITLPYEMDDKNFHNVINVKGRSYLLPLKHKALQYFPIEKWIAERREESSNRSEIVLVSTELLKVCIDRDETIITVELSIPVRNISGNRRNKVTLRKVYNLEKDVVYPAGDQYLETSLSVGIAPFIKIPSENDENRYVVQLQYIDLHHDTASLSFIRSGQRDPLQISYESLRGKAPVSVYYKFKGLFDVIRLSLSEGRDVDHPAIAGMIIPNMPEFVGGASRFFYSVDFGTTNTHIAFVSDQPGATAVSFSEKDIDMQVVYLAKKPDVSAYIAEDKPESILEAMNVIYGEGGRELPIAQGQQFFPNFAGTDYTFPIRTAVYEEELISDDLFGKMSIGFRYHKELFQDPHYRTSIKWDLSAARTQEAKERAKMFFEELLLMIRAHWLSQPQSNLADTPIIMLTYPLAMPNSSVFAEQWNSAYKRAFGASTTAKFMSMPESLAPAQKLISNGAIATQGILNVDIGGGTTDLQYYRATTGRPIARYNSVLFAGDDLWGTGYENVYTDDREVKENIFTRFAQRELGQTRLKIGYESVDFNKLQKGENAKTGKEFVNILLRDKERQFLNRIPEAEQGNSLARKVVMLHYAALIYHIAHWIKSDAKMAEKFPSLINFTGFGAKYIEAIFGLESPDNNMVAAIPNGSISPKEALNIYTAELFKAFGIEDLPIGLQVEFAPNPKAVTAEGAAIFARQGAVRIPYVDVRHYGYASSDSKEPLRFRDIDKHVGEVRDFFLNFLKAFNSVNHPDLHLPSLTDAEQKKLIEQASTSFEQVQAYRAVPTDTNGELQISDSLFFWMLKGALFDLDK